MSNNLESPRRDLRADGIAVTIALLNQLEPLAQVMSWPVAPVLQVTLYLGGLALRLTLASLTAEQPMDAPTLTGTP